MSLDEIPQKMLESKLFQNLSPSEVDSLYAVGKLKTLKAGEIMVKENQEGEEFFWILSGRLTVYIGSVDGGKHLELNVIKDGDIVGELVLLGKNRRTASVQAQSDCQVMSWNREDCVKLFHKDASLGYCLMSNFAQILGDRIQEMNLHVRNQAEISNLHLLSAAHRP